MVTGKGGTVKVKIIGQDVLNGKKSHGEIRR